MQDSLIDPQLRKGEDVPAFGTGLKIRGTSDTDTILEGDAELRHNGASIKGDWIHYTEVTDEVFARGTVRLFQDGNHYFGPELRLNLDDYRGYFVSPQFLFDQNEGRGFADRANFFSRAQATFINPIYTTCPPGNYEWFLSADTIDVDSGKDEGIAHNATLYFQDVPIIASPWLSFPLSQGRQSGFLPPTFSLSSTSGLQILEPYYWNIATNRDLTLEPNFMTDRGLQLGADFRYLESNSSGEFKGQWLQDQETHTARYSYALTDNWTGVGILKNFSGSVSLNGVSDSNYFEDFASTLAAASTRTLQRDVEMTYSQPDWYTTARVLNYQTLEIQNNYIIPPYNKLPEFLFHGALLDRGGFDFSLDADFTRFEGEGEVSGDRAWIKPSISYPVIGPGWFITPKVSYLSTIYNLTDTAPGQPTELTRNLPTFSINSGLEFDRDTTIFGRALEQTLEPQLFYVRTPFRNQSQIPVFDSAIPDFNFTQLFTENTFTGYDRIADANQLTAAVTTRLIDPETGDELVRAAIGERYYLSQQLVNLPGLAPVNSDKSDFLALVSGQVTSKITVNTGIDYSSVAGGMERSNVGVQWTPAPTEALSFDYRYLRGQFDQYDFSGQWPLGGGWYGIGRVDYSSRDRRLVEGLGGVEYRGCCWTLRIAAESFVTSLTTSTMTMFVQLELNGFSQIGSNPFETLRRNIVGFQSYMTPGPPASVFNNYE